MKMANALSLNSLHVLIYNSHEKSVKMCQVDYKNEAFFYSRVHKHVFTCTHTSGQADEHLRFLLFAICS